MDMKSAKVIGPRRAISARIAASAGVVTVRAPRSSLPAPGSPLSAAPSPHRQQAQAGTHERVPAEEDGDRRRDGCGRQRSQPAIGDAIRQQQVRREPILGSRPGRLVGAQPVGEEDACIDHGSVPEPS
jgi:hypothetical protein